MFLFGSSKEDKKPAMRGEDCSQMKRDVDGLDRFLQQVIDGDYTARAPQAHSPEMQRLGRKMEQLLQKQRDDLRSMLMTLNESVYDSTEVSEALNAIVTENIHVSARIDEMHKVVESLANEIMGLAGTATETSDQTRQGMEAMRNTENSIDTVSKETAAAEESLGRRRKKYNIEAEGYVLRIADTALEIIEEGRVQKHCVAGYAERHLADKLTIMFLRRAETPNTALYTIEMQGNKLIQIHGYKNDWEAEVKPWDEMAWLIEPWLKWLEAGSPRDKKGQPKIKFTKEERKTA